MWPRGVAYDRHVQAFSLTLVLRHSALSDPRLG